MADYRVTVAGAGNNSGSSWANAMAMADFETHAEGSAAAGDRYFVTTGTYTIGSAFDTSSQAGTAVAPIWIIGVKVAAQESPDVTDFVTGDDRPLFAMEANLWKLGEYWRIYNLRFTGSHNDGMYLNYHNFAFNCKSSCSGISSIEIEGDGSVVACEGTGGTNALKLGPNCSCTACYLHDVTDGILSAGIHSMIFGSIIDTCSGDGIDINSRDHGRIINCTIYNCAKGISAANTATDWVILNNIIKCDVGGSQVGIDWTSQTWSNYLDFNCMDSDDPIQDTDVLVGFYDVYADPGMTDPGAGNFSVQSADPVNDAGLDVGQFTGATV